MKRLLPIKNLFRLFLLYRQRLSANGQRPIKIFSLLLLLGASVLGSAFAPAAFSRWERLGTRTVNYQLDRDEIPVTLLEGTFDAVKLVVLRSPIHVHRFVIHYSNGGEQEVWVRQHLPKGGETRAIDLRGGNRGIRKVVFWYDTKDFARGRAIIELWGRH